MTTPAAAPANEKVTMDSLLGPKLLVKADGGAKHTKTLLKDKDLVALYFSASWCPPCKIFSPLFREFYNAAAKEKGLEVVYVSSDKDVESFTVYVSVECNTILLLCGCSVGKILLQQFCEYSSVIIVGTCGIDWAGFISISCVVAAA